MQGRRAISLLSVLFLLSACHGTLLPVRPPLLEEGEVSLYMQPFPQEADALRFTVSGISVRTGDGRELPFDLSVKEFRGGEFRNQRLLGTARLPEGSYQGLTMTIKEAFLRGEEGDAALLAPDKPVMIDFPFQIRRQRGYLLTLMFQPRASVADGFSFRPVFSVAMPARPVPGLTGYVSNLTAHHLTVFDKRSGQAAGLISLTGGPAGMVLDRRHMRLYTALPDGDAIDVIDVMAGEVIDRIRLTTGDTPRELALTPDARTLLAVNAGSRTVSFIDLPSLSEISRVAIGNGPGTILMDREGRRAYVFNSYASDISVIDVPNRTLAAAIATDVGPLRGQFSRQGDKLYVIHEWSAYLSVIDTRTLKVTRRMQVGMGKKMITVDSNTDFIYLAGASDVGVYDPFSLLPIDFILTGSAISYMTIDGDENKLIMVAPAAQKLIMANLISKKTVSVIDVGESPYWVTMMGERLY